VQKFVIEIVFESATSQLVTSQSLLAAEIGQVVWGTPAIFNGFRVLAAYFTARQSSSGRQTNCGVEQRAPPMFGRAII